MARPPPTETLDAHKLDSARFDRSPGPPRETMAACESDDTFAEARFLRKIPEVDQNPEQLNANRRALILHSWGAT
eukprot:5631425-Lingulodinium_polyedra.AAC.1